MKISLKFTEVVTACMQIQQTLDNNKNKVERKEKKHTRKTIRKKRQGKLERERERDRAQMLVACKSLLIVED